MGEANPRCHPLAPMNPRQKSIGFSLFLGIKESIQEGRISNDNRIPSPDRGLIPSLCFLHGLSDAL